MLDFFLLLDHTLFIVLIYNFYLFEPMKDGIWREQFPNSNAIIAAMSVG